MACKIQSITNLGESKRCWVVCLIFSLFVFSSFLTLPVNAGGGADIKGAVKSSDTTLEGEKVLEEKLVGKTFNWGGGARSVFAEDGRYIYTGSRGKNEGMYKIFPDLGYICIVFDNGDYRCDKCVLNSDGKFTLINGRGRRIVSR